MNYSKLLDLYRAGTVTESDLDGITAEDWFKVRQEAGDGLLACGFSDHALSKADKAEGSGAVPYVLVSDALIPPFSDRVEARAWDFKEFVYRGSNVLYDHNIEESRPPIGKVSDLKKGVELNRGGEAFKAVTGDVSFVPRESYAFAGMIADLVDGGYLTNGSVGFDVVKMRAPSEEEQEEFGMKPYSAIIQKANLIEFSITPLGRDKNAQRFASTGLDPLEEKLAEFAREGIYDDAVIGEFRETLARNAGQAIRCTVTKPELPGAHVTTTCDVHMTNPSSAVGGNERIGFFDFGAHPSGIDMTATANWSTFAYASDLAALRADVEALRGDLDAAREELREMREERDRSLYDYLLGDDAVEAKDTPDETGATGEGADPDLYDLAVRAGYAPNED